MQTEFEDAMQERLRRVYEDQQRLRALKRGWQLRERVIAYTGAAILAAVLGLMICYQHRWIGW